jgi:hypothetical protein
VLLSRIVAKPKNIRKIPGEILEKVQGFKADNIVAACVRKITETAIAHGDFAHLGLAAKDGTLEVTEEVVPRPDRGKFSKINVEGEVIVRRDKPLETRYHTVETPNWGDEYNGTHPVDLPHHAYPREYAPGPENEIAVQPLGTEHEPELAYLLKFRVSEVMDRKKQDFKERLFFNLNLLLENAGAIDVFQSDASFDDYMKTIYVRWEILPPGERDANIARIIQHLPDKPEIRERIQDRYDFLEKLKPMNFIQGLGGFKRYFGAKFSDQLVVLENMEYGNAIYVMFADWKEQSKKTRQELLASGREGKDFIRVPHLEGWKAKVTEAVNQRKDA